jgi:hypothetical protein
VAFCHATGATHLLTDAAAAVFCQLSEAAIALSTEDLLDQLASRTVDPDDAAAISVQELEILEQALASLEEIRLIRRHT